MKIAGIKAALPSRIVSNRHIEDMVNEHSTALSERDLREALRRINFFLTYSGSKERRWLSDGETPFELLSQAVNEAIAEAQLQRSEIALIIYTGVDRGFLEPAMAYLIGAALGMPQAHCFDIVDEGNPRGGERARNWDACQFALFTLHSSGHNPRPAQGARQRQRIYHKFFMYPEKFGETLCTGCGNCARNCPVGLGVLPLVSEICHAESV